MTELAVDPMASKDETREFAAMRRAGGLSQLANVLGKTCKLKASRPVATCCEFILPILIVAALVPAWAITGFDKEPAVRFVNSNVTESGATPAPTPAPKDAGACLRRALPMALDAARQAAAGGRRGSTAQLADLRDACAITAMLQGDPSDAFECLKCRRPGATAPLPRSPGSAELLWDCDADEDESGLWGPATPCLGDMCMPLATRAFRSQTMIDGLEQMFGSCIGSQELPSYLGGGEVSTVRRAELLVVSLMQAAGSRPVRVPGFDTMVLLRTYGRQARGGFRLSRRSERAGFLERLGPVGEAVTTGNLIGVVEAAEDRSAGGTPRHLLVAELRRHLNETTYTFRYAELRDSSGAPFDSEARAVSHSSSVSGSGSIFGLIAVRGDGSYTLRMNSTAVPDTESGRSFKLGLDDKYFQYVSAGFMTLQEEADAFFAARRGVPAARANVREWHAPMPIDAYNVNTFLAEAGEFVPLFISFAFLVVVSLLTSAIVREKEERVREGMMIMGLRLWVFRAGWLVFGLLQMAAVSLICAALLSGTLLPETDFGLIFLVFMLYTLSVIEIAVACSALFSKAKDASAAAPFVFLAMMAPLMLNIPKGARNGLMILSTFAFGVALENIFSFEKTGEGVTFEQNMDKPDGDVTTRTAVIMLIVDNVLYLLLGLYLDNVVPSEWGTHEHPCFCLTCCCCCFGGSSDKVHEAEPPSQVNDKIEKVTDPSTLAAEHVRLTALRKVFGRGEGAHVAVDDLTMSFYRGQCTVLLGHNGAGKTTTINMITGMLPVSAGDALVGGYSVKRDMKSIRQGIGLCPQHNIIWPELSCADHLRFYGRLKGLSGAQLQAKVEEYLQEVELMPHPVRSPHIHNKKDYRAGMLSGGQKRKLCVAIALIGTPSLVIFDEPTAGMDVEARRAIWDLLKREKQGRAMLLTTHFMDEADLLGDRIAIMHHGKLYCCGSSLFLKSRLGAGYVLKLDVGRPRAPSEAQDAESASPSSAKQEAVLGGATPGSPGASPAAQRKNVIQIGEFLKKTLLDSVVPESSLETECVSAAGSEVVFMIPLRAVPAFPHLFRQLEDHRDELGLRSFGVSVTTLEEIFLRIASADAPPTSLRTTKAADVQAKSPTSAADDHDALVEDADGQCAFACPEEERLRGPRLFNSHLRAMIYKRYSYTRRDRRTLCLMVILPPLIMCFALAMSKLLNIVLDKPARDIAPGGSGYPFGTQLVAGPQQAPEIAHFPAGFSLLAAAAGTWGAMDDFLLDTSKKHGAVDRLTAVSIPNATHGPYGCVPGERCAAGVQPAGEALCFHNSTFWHAAPMALSALHSARMTMAVPSAAPLETTNHPLPESDFMKELVNSFLLIFEGLLLLIPFTFIPSAYTSFLVRERVVKSKHVQLVSGVRLPAFWLGTFLWDVMLYLITMALALILFAAYNRQEYIGDADVGMVTFLHLFLYGIASIGLSYWLSFYFEDHSKAQTYVLTGNFVCGWILVLVARILLSIEKTQDIGKALRFPFRIVPAYCLGDGIITLSSRPLMSTYADFIGDSSVVPSAWTWGVDRSEGTLWNITFMAVEIPVFFLLALAHDFPQLLYMLRLRTPPAPEGATGDAGRLPDDEDEDVAEERAAVEQGQGRTGDLVRVVHLRKEFAGGRVVAVKNLTLGVQAEEIFAFLGTNGAGKTTTLSVLSGEFYPTAGSASINGFDVVTQTQEARQQLGYCPQFDALLDLLTPREHLRLYANLRGVPEERIEPMIDSLLAVLQLEAHADKQCKDLSGGNKRKASIAISLVGGPAVLFLDEPTAGMDPVARRGMWRALQSVGRGRSVVLTTHHLEEVEALAHRVAIMVSGELKCIGSLTHLKEKFGGGYEFDAKTATMDDARRLRAFVDSDELLQGAELKEQAGERLTYQLRSTAKLSQLFEKIESVRGRFNISDYSINQTSLEQVFMAICRREMLKEDAARPDGRAGDIPAGTVKVTKGKS